MWGEGLAMEEQVTQRTGQHPGAYLLDGGFVHLGDIETLEGRGVRVYAPPKKGKGGQKATPKPGAEPGVMAWRERMETEEGQVIYSGMCQCAVPNEVWNATLDGAWCDQGHQRCPTHGRHPQPVALGRVDRLKLRLSDARSPARAAKADNPEMNPFPITLEVNPETHQRFSFQPPKLPAVKSSQTRRPE